MEFHAFPCDSVGYLLVGLVFLPLLSLSLDQEPGVGAAVLIRRHTVSGQIAASGGIEISDLLVESTLDPSATLVRKATEEPSHDNGIIEISKGLADSAPELSTILVHKASKGQVQVTADGSIEEVSNGLTDSTLALSSILVRKASERQAQFTADGSIKASHAKRKEAKLKNWSCETWCDADTSPWQRTGVVLTYEDKCSWSACVGCVQCKAPVCSSFSANSCPAPRCSRSGSACAQASCASYGCPRGYVTKNGASKSLSLRNCCQALTPAPTDLTPSPTDPTLAPTVATPVPTDVTPVPTVSTLAPTDATPAPTAATPEPTDSTPSPTDLTPTPTVSTPAPTNPTPAPTAPTPAPTDSTPSPSDLTPTPTVATPVPTYVTPVPTVSTLAPTDATAAPTAATPVPTDSTPSPTDLTPTPTVSTPAPTDATPEPTAPTQAPLAQCVDNDTALNAAAGTPSYDQWICAYYQKWSNPSGGGCGQRASAKYKNVLPDDYCCASCPEMRFLVSAGEMPVVSGTYIAQAGKSYWWIKDDGSGAVLLREPHKNRWIIFNDRVGVSGHDPYFQTYSGAKDGWRGPWFVGRNGKGGVYVMNSIEASAFYSSTVTPGSGYGRSDTTIIKNELFSGRGVSQPYGPHIAHDVVLDISGWSLEDGDSITLHTWSSANALQTERNGQWVEESSKVIVNVGSYTQNGAVYTILYKDGRGVATKIRQQGSSSKQAYFYTGKGEHALLVNGQPVVDGVPIHLQYWKDYGNRYCTDYTAHTRHQIRNAGMCKAQCTGSCNAFALGSDCVTYVGCIMSTKTQNWGFRYYMHVAY